MFSATEGEASSLLQDIDTDTSGHAVREDAEFIITFRVSRIEYVASLSDNAAQLDSAVAYIARVLQGDASFRKRIVFCGAASPEGSSQFNHWLSVNRRQVLEGLVRDRVEIPDSLILRTDGYIPWSWLREQVSGDKSVPDKDEVLSILEEEPSLEQYMDTTQIDRRVGQLKRLSRGRTWKVLFDRYFARMRNAYVLVVTVKDTPLPEPIPSLPAFEVPPLQAPPTYFPVLKKEIPKVEEEEECGPGLYIKTNLAGLAMLMSNAGVEADIAQHWSAAFSSYYSCWDYFKPTVKFRTLAYRPELRWWPSECNAGFFIDVHAELAWYNFAFDGKWRYQDHRGKSPSLGGGAGLGWRLQLGDSGRWFMEAAIGGGVYPLHYDTFYNTHDYRDGGLDSTSRKVWFGVDKVALTIAYRFDLKKEWRERR